MFLAGKRLSKYLWISMVISVYLCVVMGFVWWKKSL